MPSFVVICNPGAPVFSPSHSTADLRSSAVPEGSVPGVYDTKLSRWFVLDGFRSRTDPPSRPASAGRASLDLIETEDSFGL